MNTENEVGQQQQGCVFVARLEEPGTTVGEVLRKMKPRPISAFDMDISQVHTQTAELGC